jgi:hypothetical protein
MAMVSELSKKQKCLRMDYSGMKFILRDMRPIGMGSPVMFIEVTKNY